jgi:hypothetical protein
MQTNDLELAKIKKDLYVGILNTGSNVQKERALDTAREIYDWCVSHIRYEENIDTIPSRRGRPKKADT